MAPGDMRSAIWEPIPGPADRITFFEEQRRNRRRAKRAALLCGLVMALTGIGLSAVIMPVVGILLVNHVRVYSPGLYQTVQNVAAGLGSNPPSRSAVLLTLAAWLLPGAVLVLLLWVLIRSLFLGSTSNVASRIASERSALLMDWKERQLANVVQELALAAGIESPRVVVLENVPANAGISGSSPRDATVMVSRRMLNEFTRDQAQGALAIVVSSIANGDLYVLYNTLSLFEAFGAVLALITFPFSPTSRRACWSLLKLAIAGKGDAHAVGELLLHQASVSGMTEMNAFMARRMEGTGLKSLIGSLIVFLLLPLLLMSIFAFTITTLAPLFFAGPLLAMEWRHRRHLADATAVQLTRNPDAVAQALFVLTERGGVIKNQRWADLFFIVGPEIWAERKRREYAETAQEVQRRLAGKSQRERAAERLKIAMEFQAAARERAMRMRSDADNGTAAKLGIVGTFHPSINSRMRQLRALGARVDWQFRREFPVWVILLPFILLVAVGLLAALLEVLKSAR